MVSLIKSLLFQTQGVQTVSSYTKHEHLKKEEGMYLVSGLLPIGSLSGHMGNLSTLLGRP